MKDMSFLVTELIAHRGLHSKYVKENSLEAIDKAIEKNIPIEFDVTMTKDCKIIVCHDNYIKVGSEKYIISLNSYQFLKKHCHNIVTLEEVLNFVNGRIPLLIEIKPYNKGNKLENNIVKMLDNYKGVFAIQSFNPFTINWFKKNRNSYIRGLLLTANKQTKKLSGLICRHLILHRFTNPDFICYNIKGLPDKQVSKIRKKKIVIGWTIKTENQLKKYKNYCDNFICDNIFSNRRMNDEIK